MDKHKVIRSVPSEELSAFLRGVLVACRDSIREMEHLAGDIDGRYEYCIGTLSIIDAMNRIGNLGLTIPSIKGNKKKEIEELENLIYAIERTTSDLLTVYGTDDDRNYIQREKVDVDLYRFEKDDFDRVQQLINELREIVAKTRSVDEEHKLRLLKRLEKLQSELHKRTSNFDRFWGLLGEVGPIIGKFGEDTKPFVDRLRELMEIVTRTQTKANNRLEQKPETRRVENSSHTNDDAE